MNATANMNALSINQIVNALLVNGSNTTMLVQGEMGWGKSSILGMLAKKLPSHIPCYFDCTTKDAGDTMLPILTPAGDTGTAPFIRYATNEELGVHHLNQPVIIMVDELGKAVGGVKNSLMRLFHEGKIGNITLHPDSLVFATTNLGAEGVGDILMPHHRNRMTVVTMRKPDALEWLEWGVNNAINPVILGFAREFPQIFHSFTDHTSPDENQYIYHPRASARTAFVTGRSLEKASTWIDKKDLIDDATLTATLIGTLGERAALDLSAFLSLVDQLPKTADIIANPCTTPVPTSVAAICMVVYRILSNIERGWVAPWMEYLNRLPLEAQGLFCNGVRTKGYSRQSLVVTDRAYQTWALKNSYLFTADKA